MYQNNYGYNPYNMQSPYSVPNSTQQRLQNLEQQYPQFAQQNQQQQKPIVNVLPVSNIEEAKASRINLDGSLYVFADTINDKFYTKKLNNDGKVDFCIYSKEVASANPQQPKSEYVTKKEFNDLINKINAMSKGVKNEQSKSE